jgi:thymidylate synthase
MHQLIADTLDDLLVKVFPKILQNGQRVKASKGWNRELSGVVLELRNPLARLSRSETKGTVFSCLGETLWYLAGSIGFESLVVHLRFSILTILRRVTFVQSILPDVSFGLSP